jgi:hypothetical protein
VASPHSLVTEVEGRDHVPSVTSSPRGASAWRRGEGAAARVGSGGAEEHGRHASASVQGLDVGGRLAERSRAEQASKCNLLHLLETSQF